MITALIVCKNEEKNIERCLKSVLWTGSIILIDGNSTDRTVEIASNYTNNIYRNEWKGYTVQKHYGLSKTETEWIFSIDADEFCTEELSNEILNLLSNPGLISENGFYIPRRNFFFDKKLKYGGSYPDYQLRLFRKDAVKLTDRLVHESFMVDGNTGFLKNNIEHYTISSIDEYLERINKYSSLSAREKINKKKSSILKIIIIPYLEFLKKYIFQLGFLDGKEGFFYSVFHYLSKLYMFIKIWELQNTRIK